MKFHWALFRWQLRNIYPVNLVMGVLFASFFLFSTDLLKFRESQPYPAFVLMHLSLMSILLSHMNSRAFSFLHGQGFSRDRLWAHTVFATLFSGLLVTGLSAVIILTGLRSFLQDQFGNYRFPLMAAEEYPFVGWMLVAYLILIPVLHYCGLRILYPGRGAAAGVAIAIAFVISLARDLWVLQSYGSSLELILLICGCYVLASTVLFISGWKLHRQAEVI